ncbi:uncharacterized protein TNCV_1653271 [Trichonephila clavipes]|nr:uncharacterized protein TNCV_1653271 [Trichonephila clavipes]
MELGLKFSSVLLLLKHFHELINSELLIRNAEVFECHLNPILDLFARQDRQLLQSHYEFHQFYQFVSPQTKDESTRFENPVNPGSTAMRPIIVYASPVWGYVANTNINILDTLQNSLIPMIVKATSVSLLKQRNMLAKFQVSRSTVQKREICIYNPLVTSHNQPSKSISAKYILVKSLFLKAAVAEWYRYRYRIVACLVTSSSPVPLKTRRVGQRCTLNLSRAETSSRWCGMVVRRGGASSGVVHVT